LLIDQFLKMFLINRLFDQRYSIKMDRLLKILFK